MADRDPDIEDLRMSSLKLIVRAESVYEQVIEHLHRQEEFLDAVHRVTDDEEAAEREKGTT